MPSLVPFTTDVQFVSGAAGSLTVASLVDPSGNPTSVLDIDLGFTLSGTVTLPGWLSGRGIIRLAADEIGGPIDQIIGTDNISITGATLPTDPPNITYSWAITVKSPALPDDSQMYQLGLLFVFQTNAGGHTDIGAFYDLGAYLVV